MSAHKHIDKICIFITILAVLITTLFMNGEAYGLTPDSTVSMGYEDTLFDDSYVHTINIEIDDWDGFIDTATDEVYSSANVTIDGETLKNVGIRAKGNTSLSTVAQLNSERYSLKIEFDCFQDNLYYHGLDKLCLNNLIQDYTMMKDYLAYKMMAEFGADAPLCSFVYVTINGEDWGLFLAVEAVEDSFLERNYGRAYGDLYKPDSMSMGGGRGNGGGFDMKDMDFDELGIKNPFENNNDNSSDGSNTSDSTEGGTDANGPSQPPSGAPSGMPSFGGNNDTDSSSENSFPGFPGGDTASGSAIGGNMPDFSGGFPGGGGFGGFGMGSSDAKLQYIDDDADSYSTIFDSAKTTVKKKDKTRLIESLKNLSEGLTSGDAEQIASAVNVDEVLRYMVVHNFVVNGDSYTGSMIHNYYLYEEDGLMSMIPWDYNLAYGTFQGGDGTSAVNDPIDTPLSITEGSTDRPMFSWITSCEEYTEMYHEYYQQFLEQFYESGYLAELIDSVHDMIAEYVEKDPTKFCTYEEFETAVSTLKSFVELRCQSIAGQLDGTIGSTDSAQEADSSSLIDASSLNLSSMGSMGGGMGGGGNSGFGPDATSGASVNVGDTEKSSGGNESSSNTEKSESSSTESGFPGGDFPSNGEAPSGFPGGGRQGGPGGKGGFPGGNFPSRPGSDSSSSEESSNGSFSFPGGFPGGDTASGSSISGGPFGNGGPGGDFSGFPGASSTSSSLNTTNLIYLGVCVAALLVAIIIAKKFKNR